VRLRSLRRVDVDKGRAAKDPEVGKVRVTSSEGGEGDDAITLGPGTIANVDHRQEGETPKPIGKRGREEESFRTIGECAPLSLDTSKLPVGVRDCSFDGYGRGTTDGGKGSAEKNGVVVDANPRGLIAERGDGGEDVSPGRRSIGLDLHENGDDGSGCVADCAENVAVAGGVGGRGGTPDVQSQSVKGMRGITITSRAAIN
jgi:hypothetical protein